MLPMAVTLPSTLRASDHADGPTVAGDQAADLADSYFFTDPLDSSKVVLINTVRGFIVPGEAVNLVVFDSTIRYRFQIFNNEDAKPDGFIDVSFSEKKANRETGAPLPQTATVTFSGKLQMKGTFTGLTTNPTLAPVAAPFPNPPQRLKNRRDNDSQVEFFAGETDDPFFFDIPGFARFRAKAVAGDSSAGAELQRGRDTFAGYNVLTIAFRLDKSLLQPRAGSEKSEFGLSVLSQRQTERVRKGRKVGSGPFQTVDREGLPGINALLVPLNLKNKYNAGDTLLDASGRFAGPIVATLQSLGISDENLAVLAGLAVTRGDVLRLDTGLPTAFPNGRKPSDDVVATILSVVAGTTLDDNVPNNDVPFQATFPYLGLPHQPRTGAGNVDDNTRN